MPEPGKRRLAAVLFSDIKGYSSQMGADEERTLARLREHNAIFREQVAKHGGRVVKTVGDAFMVEFGSAVDAVACGLDVQRALAAYNANKAEADRIEVRIGVNAGDVVVEGEDLFGETVNIAARLEGRAPPGGICVTQPVFEQLRRRVNATATDLGPQQLKNLPAPIQLYALVPGEMLLEAPAAARPKPKRRAWLLPASVGALALGLVLFKARSPAEPVPGESGGKLRVGLLVQRGSFDVYGHVYTVSQFALGYVVEGLVLRTLDGDSIPGPVQRWDASDDGRTITLQLRERLRFHDHRCFEKGIGRDATAEDVVYSLQVAARQELIDMPLEGLAPFVAGSAKAISGVAASGERTVKLSLTRPAPFADLDLQRVWLLPRELEGCENPRKLNWPVGTGPFLFARAPSGERLELLRNDAWWQKPPVVEAVELGVLTDALGGLQELGAGKLDVAVLLPDQAAPVMKFEGGKLQLLPELEPARLQVGTSPSAGLTIIAALVAIARPGGALETQKLREAFARAIDRRAVTAQLAMAKEPFGRLLAPWHLGARPDIDALEHDPRRVSALLADAGHAGGSGLKEIALGVYPVRRKAAEEIQRQAEELGLRVRIVEVGAENVERAFREKTLDAWLGMIFGNTRGSEPWPYLRNLVEEQATSFITLGPEFTTAVSQVVSEPDRDRRAELYGKIEAHLLRELPLIPIGLASQQAPTVIYVASPRVADMINPQTGRLIHDPSVLFTKARLTPEQQP